MGVALALALVACGISRLPTPAYTPQPSSAYAEVPYPPPPARVEFVPPRPSAGAVWIDGEWAWEGARWAWKRGRWVAPPSGATFSPWTATRDATGVLYVAEGVWRDEAGRAIASPAALAEARPAGGTVVNSEGETMPPAPVVRDDTGPKQGDAGTPTPIDAALGDALAMIDAEPIATDGAAR